MCDFNCFLLFLLISFDVQDVVIDVHDFRVCACLCVIFVWFDRCV